MVFFRDNRLYLTLLGGLLVTSGVVAKNTAEQLDEEDGIIAKYVGPTSFVLGWIIVAYSLSMTNARGYLAALNLNRRTIQIFASAAAIVVSVFMMKRMAKAGITPPAIYPAMFAGGWLLLGYSVGNYYGMAAALLVLFSMMGVLPWQRQNCVVDGPGMPMFAIAWVVLAVGNSLN